MLTLRSRHQLPRGVTDADYNNTYSLIGFVTLLGAPVQPSVIAESDPIAPAGGLRD